MHRTTKLVVNIVLHVRTLHDDIIHDKVMVAVMDIELLHRRMGHMGSVALKRLGRDGIVHGLAGGVSEL